MHCNVIQWQCRLLSFNLLFIKATLDSRPGSKLNPCGVSFSWTSLSAGTLCDPPWSLWWWWWWWWLRWWWRWCLSHLRSATSGYWQILRVLLLLPTAQNRPPGWNSAHRTAWDWDCQVFRLMMDCVDQEECWPGHLPGCWLLQILVFGFGWGLQHCWLPLLRLFDAEYIDERMSP